MRFLIVDDDSEYRQLLRYHLDVEWPDASIDEHQPTSTGYLPPGLVLADLDLVLLGHPVARDESFTLLKSLRGRPDCPPIFVFASPSDEFVAVDALKAGAASYFPKDKVRHHRLVDAIRAEMRTERPSEDTGNLLVNHKAMNGAHKRRLLGKLYAGELSSVYLAEAEDSGERIAFKVLRHVPDSGGTRTFDRFLQEYEVIARVRHPNVVKIFDLGVADDHAYIAMEYLGAGSLAERLNTALDPDQSVHYATQVGSALAAIHEAGILHRDLKPPNVMLRDNDDVALIDFGLARNLEGGLSSTRTGVLRGSPYYMSPEQALGEELDARTDFYSLGIIFYEMLTGRKPFAGTSAIEVLQQHVNSPVPTLPERHSQHQPLIDRMLAKSREQRFASAEEVIEAVGTAREARSPQPTAA